MEAQKGWLNGSGEAMVLGGGGWGGCHEIVSNKSRRGGEAWERVVGEVVEE